ncbi:MAG: DUF2807 domain-containing protein, partial [Burkholderiaceae bacterium]|nr:DUF2807 domain-containing protein [Burkholderiaceae bacterium]
MKNQSCSKVFVIPVFLSFLIVLLTACEINVSHDELRGNGKIITEKRAAGSFSAIENTSQFDITVNADGPANIEVTGDDNLVKEVETVIEGSTLKIKNKRQGNVHISWSKNPLLVKVTTPSLNQVRNSGSGDIRLSQLHDEKLDIQSEGSGDLIATGKIADLNVKSNGSGDVHLSDLIIKKLNLEMNGSGDVRLNQVTQSMNITNNSSADLEVTHM